MIYILMIKSECVDCVDCRQTIVFWFSEFFISWLKSNSTGNMGEQTGEIFFNEMFVGASFDVFYNTCWCDTAMEPNNHFTMNSTKLFNIKMKTCHAMSLLFTSLTRFITFNMILWRWTWWSERVQTSLPQNIVHCADCFFNNCQSSVDGLTIYPEVSNSVAELLKLNQYWILMAKIGSFEFHIQEYAQCCDFPYI